MRELAGRLRAIDPQAGEALRIIRYFDALSRDHASAVSVVRGAAILADAPAGVRLSGRVCRVGPDGRVLNEPHHGPTEGAPWSTSVVGGPLAWIERDGPTLPDDQMIADRLSLGVGIASDEPHLLSPVETLLSHSDNRKERSRAASRLRIRPDEGLILVATHPTSPPPEVKNRDTPTAVITTGIGAVRASILSSEAALTVTSPAGLASAAHADAIPAAWLDAQTALLLARHRYPVVNATDAGAVISLLRPYLSNPDSLPGHRDVEALAALDDQTLDILDAISETASIRQASTALRLHHSSLQAKVRKFSRHLGYDLSAPSGRSRYHLARQIMVFRINAGSL